MLINDKNIYIIKFIFFIIQKGAPYPEQEENAIDCVMQFAIHKLGFAENKIILNGWSIGGYTASWAAMNYPSVHSLVRCKIIHVMYKLINFFLIFTSLWRRI